jgi:acyl-CoA synthetase (AMP-forming)/AMP-acid ligase II
MDAVASFRPFPDITRNFARTQPDRIALSFEGRETTYADFEKHTNQVANALIAADVKQGDRVAFLGKNSDTYFEVFFGTAKMGGVTAPINWRLAGPEVAYILRDSRAPILFVGPEFIDVVKKIAGECPDLKTIVATEAKAGNWPAYAEWRDANTDAMPQHRLEPASDALQLYTSGTTGRAKGVMLSAGNLVSLQDVMDRTGAEWANWSPSDVSLVAMPVGHIAGTGWGFWTLVRGAKAIIVRDFDPGRILDLIEREKINKLFLVPSALQAVVNHPRAREVDYAHLQYISYGASPIPLALLRECVAVFGCGFIQMYGMTETTGTIVALPPEDHTMEDSAKMRSAGKPLPGVEVVILDASGKRLAAHEVGEIAVRSSSNMKGYWNQPEATEATIDKDGWLRTGDAGYVDEEGYLYIHDRVKDMIISGGENVYPAEVENAIYGHPDVAEVAVIGVPSQRWGEEVKAIIVPKPGRTPREEDVIAWARERIAAFKAPKSIEVIEAFPRTATGKVLRRELKAKYWQGFERKVN